MPDLDLNAMNRDTQFKGDGVARRQRYGSATDTVEFHEWVYFGVPTTDGTFRIGQNAGATLVIQKRILGTYTQVFEWL